MNILVIVEQLIVAVPFVVRCLALAAGALPVLFALLLGWYYWKYWRILSVARKLPTGLPTLPLLGHAHHVLKGFSEMVFFMLKSRLSEENIAQTFCLWSGPYPIFVVNRAEDIKTVINSSKTIDKSFEYKTLQIFLGNGLLMSKGERHRVLRRHVNPMFHSQNLQQMFPVFNQTCRHLVQDMSELFGRGHVDISATINVAVLRQVGSIAFGPDIEFDTKSEEFRVLLMITTGYGELWLNRFLKFWLWPDFIFHFLWRKEIRDIHNRWKKFSERPLKILEQRQQVMTENNSNTNGAKEDSDYTYSEFLTLPDMYRHLQRSHPQYTYQDLQKEMLSFFFAGTDTTRITVCSCLLSLAANPDIQDKLYQEITSVLGVEEEEVTLKHLHDLPYLDQVIKETLRKFSPIPFILRSVKEDIQLNDCVVPAGATVGVSLVGLHFDPKVYPDPENFDPDRFSPENASKQNKYTLLPFSGGARNCIGGTYAQLFAKTAIIYVLKRYRLTTTVDINRLSYAIEITMMSAKGYHLQLHDRREQQSSQE